ncbi:MAG TPA: LemA family protein [Terriglobia bacterium]|nr:LemA family protein [Terriglobia bacterium]
MSASKILLIVVGIVAVVALIAGVGIAGSYNSLVAADQTAQMAWGNVQSAYQRRWDLIDNLVATVKGAANFEQGTLVAVTEARAKVGQISPQAGQDITNDPAALQRFQQATAGLDSALSRLLVVVEKYPELKATQAFRDLQSQIEGTENRINVERVRYNEAASAFNTRRDTFPTVLVAGLLGFPPKTYFQAETGAEKAPEVKF